MSELINKIAAFLDKYDMEPSRFGVLAANDSHLVHDLVNEGRMLRRKTLRKVQDFMKNYRKPRK